MMTNFTFRKLMALLIIGSLIEVPLVLAKETSSDDDKFTENAAAIGQGAVMMYGQYVNQQIQNARMMSDIEMQNKLGPGCTQNGVPCHVTPAKYFPECSITNSMVNFPTGICEAPSMDPYGVSKMSSYKKLGETWVGQFERMLNMAQNSPYPIGLKCLDDKKASLAQQLKNTINSLTALQNQLKKDSQIFRDNNKKILDELEKNNSELFGGGNSNNDKLRNMANYFSPSCQNIIGGQNIHNTGNKEGLNGILKGMTEANRVAGNYLTNRNGIEADIKRALDKINGKIRSEGVNSIFSGTIDAELQNQNPATKAVLDKIRNEYITNAKRIQEQLETIQPGYKLPVADNHFSDDTAEFISSAETTFKKQYINECLTGADRGVAIPLENVLSSLQQKSTANGGTARDKYRAALRAIIESNEGIDQKLQRIKELEALYSDITITYQNQQSIRVTQTPYQLYMDIAKACEQRYVTSANEPNSTTVSSQKKKVDRAVNLIREYKNLNDTFSAKLSQAVNEQVLNCSGSAKKTGEGICQEALNTASEKFCVAHANQCAGEVQACYLEADKQVKVREQKMQVLANQYNANVTQLVARSNNLYDQQKAQVQNLVGYMQQRFPGTQFELPKDMFISTPEQAKGKFGINLMGGGELKFLEEFPSKIEKLKEMIASQGQDTDRLLAQYMDSQKQAMEEQKNKWAGLAQKCDGLYKQSMAQINEYNKKGAEAQAKAQSAAGQFCRRFNKLKKNPIAACRGDLESTLQAMNKVEGAPNYVNQGAFDALETYSEICEEHQSEIKDAKKDAEKNKLTLANICNRGPQTSDDTFLSELQKQLQVKVKAPESKDAGAASAAGSSQKQNIDFYKEELNNLTKKYNSDKSEFENAIKVLQAQNNSTNADNIKFYQDKLAALTTKYNDDKKEFEAAIKTLQDQEGPGPSSNKPSSLIATLQDDNEFKEFMKQNSHLSKDQAAFFDDLRSYASDNSLTKPNLCGKLAGNSGSVEELKKSTLNDTLNKARSFIGDKDSVSAQLSALGEDVKEVTCEAGANTGRNIFKDLFNAPASLQNLGIGTATQ